MRSRRKYAQGDADGREDGNPALTQKKTEQGFRGVTIALKSCVWAQKNTFKSFKNQT